jgi:hypothetical protein
MIVTDYFVYSHVSMFADYARKQQYVFQILSDRGALGFEATVSRFLTLGNDNAESKNLLRRLLEETGSPITSEITAYLAVAEPLNVSSA